MTDLLHVHLLLPKCNSLSLLPAKQICHINSCYHNMIPTSNIPDIPAPAPAPVKIPSEPSPRASPIPEHFFETEPDEFGLFRHYKVLPFHDPDGKLLMDRLTLMLWHLYSLRPFRVLLWVFGIHVGSSCMASWFAHLATMRPLSSRTPIGSRLVSSETWSRYGSAGVWSCPWLLQSP